MENFSLTYVRKCRANAELQAMWKRNEGDYWANANNTVFQESAETQILDPDAKWVPSLYQIWQIARNTNRMKEFNDLQVLSKMRIAISSSCCNNYLNSQSMHDFWIMFWMYMEYSKDWNEGANKWT